MDLIEPTRTTTTLSRGNAIAFTISFAVVLIGMTTATKTPAWISIMAMGCLVFGWLLTATLITHVTSEAGLYCMHPDVTDETHAMTRVPVLIRLQNPSPRWSLLFITTELLVESVGNLLNSPPKFMGQVPARSVAEFEWSVLLRLRGEHYLRGLSARSSFPGSLLSREFAFTFDHKILALPVVYKLNPKANQVLAGRKRASGHQTSNPAAMEEFLGVREYRPGDNPRNVSMTLSMRRPDYPWQLVVREYEDLSDDEVCIVLDTAVPHEGVEDSNFYRYRHEKAISFAIALCQTLCELKHRVRLMACQEDGITIEFRINHSARDIPVLERRMARLKPTHDSDAVSRLLQRESQRSDAVLLFVSLRNEDRLRTRGFDAGLVLTPEWQASLVAEVSVA